MLKNQFFKVKNNLWELEKDFIELNNREINIKREKNYFPNGLLFL